MKLSRKSEYIVRAIFTYCILFSVSIVYLVKLFDLQVAHQTLFKKKAQDIMQRNYPIKAKRGLILDRYNKILAQDVQSSFSIYLIPLNSTPYQEKIKMLSKLENIMNLSAGELSEKINKNGIQYQDILIYKDAKYEDIVAIAEKADEFPGINWEANYTREYPTKDLFFHTVGYIGSIAEDELKYLYNKGYDADSLIGRSGVESQYENELRGEDGLGVKQIDSKGQYLNKENAVKKKPRNGNNIVLTLDKDMQELAFKSLGNRIGTVIILSPYKNEVLAMASNPSYDPNKFIKTGFDANDSKKANLIDRNIQSTVPPGSTFKIVMTAALLNRRVFPENQRINCGGSLTVGNRKFHCWYLPGHGPLNMAQALQQSCDVYFYTVGINNLGAKSIHDYALKFGYSNLTEIDLPGEVTGFIPFPEWKEKVINEPWLLGDTANMSIGQGYINVTPIQIANSISIILNNGVLYAPHVLKEVTDKEGNLVYSYKPQILSDSSGISKSVFKKLRDFLRTVVSVGSSRSVITTKAVEVAGKTGTSQTQSGLHHNEHSIFAAFAPYDAPVEKQVVVVVWIDAKNEWDWWAPKAANIIFNGIFKHLNYEDSVIDLMPNWYLPDQKALPQSQAIIEERIREMRSAKSRISMAAKSENKIAEYTIYDYLDSLNLKGEEREKMLEILLRNGDSDMEELEALNKFLPTIE